MAPKSVTGWVSQVGDEGWQECRGSANDTCQHRQLPVPAGLNHHPQPATPVRPERGPPEPPATTPPAPTRGTRRRSGTRRGAAGRVERLVLANAAATSDEPANRLPSTRG